ncbi:cytidylate kinase [Hathewaya proteolytica DSM 3090]|uniref:Cytidylate kinase n=2 Tax=Hathewaya proteolytica TaxID=29365 RepID=A0A1M6J3V9_9CLOT|nr:cytidylate kinase [Hathewaya proteolytica DSM 3090]
MNSIAIDGPAGAGKSTIAKMLAKKLEYVYINTGAMYRAVTYLALKNSIEDNNNEEIRNIIASMNIEFIDDDLFLNGKNIQDELGTPYISRNVSKYAAQKIVREELVKLQRNMAKTVNVVMDGRDIGTVVLKESNCKFFLTATPEKRAERRYKELIIRGDTSVTYEEILKDIIKRDNYDSTREIDPLRKAEDAIEIDSTDMTLEEVVDKMMEYIRNRRI